jgi:hypothetical protein
MSNALIQQQVNTLATMFSIPQSDELVSVLKGTAFKGQVTDAQMSALLIVANQYGLNPWTREIYAFPDKNNGIVPVVGVDGWSRIINDHSQFDGMDFKQDDESCTCTIYRKDRNHPIVATEYLSECKRGTQPWQSHPKRMLRHKALIQCARLAFGYTGIYDEDEAERIKDINPSPSRQTGTQAAIAARESVIIDQVDEEAKAILLANLTEVASTKGLIAYGESWMNLTKKERTLIGAEQHEKLKAIAQEYDEANKPVENKVDDFVADMEGAENE